MKNLLALALVLSNSTWASPKLLKISTDIFTNPNSQHQAEVEADNFAYGDTVVSAFQVGRFYDGGSSGIGFSTSVDAGRTWIGGFLPGITKYLDGQYDRVSDPTVAYDAAHGIWLISSLPISERRRPEGAGVMVSRSRDGIKWENPVMISEAPAKSFYDKNWTVCDNHPQSPYYGHCYTEWDDASSMIVYMSTSTDGGLTWSQKQSTHDDLTGIGGQPLVQPNGTVIVPIAGPGWSVYLYSFQSTDGGKTWSDKVQVALQDGHDIVGGLRSPGFLPSADLDANGRIYTVWSDCQFEAGCKSNDIVMTTSQDGIKWSTLVRIPIDPVGSRIEHILPGIGVDQSTNDPEHIHLGLTYYSLPDAGCDRATCRLDIGFISSNDSGKTWSKPQVLASGMKFDWLPNTTQGNMVGDYISTSFIRGNAFSTFALAYQPKGLALDQGMYTIEGGMPVSLEPGIAVDEMTEQRIPWIKERRPDSLN